MLTRAFDLLKLDTWEFEKLKKQVIFVEGELDEALVKVARVKKAGAVQEAEATVTEKLGDLITMKSLFAMWVHKRDLRVSRWCRPLPSRGARGRRG